MRIKFPNIDLDIKFREFEAGRILWDEVFNTIKKCDVVIFDISENNPNILIEVGLAYENNKHVILLKNEIPMPIKNNDRLDLKYIETIVQNSYGFNELQQYL